MANQKITKRTDNPSRRACLNSAHMLIRCLLHFSLFFCCCCCIWVQLWNISIKIYVQIEVIFLFYTAILAFVMSLFGFVNSWFDFVGSYFLFLLKFISNAPAFFSQPKMNTNILPLSNDFYHQFFVVFSSFNLIEIRTKTIRLFANIIQICSISTANVHRFRFGLVWFEYYFFSWFKKIPLN